MSADASHVAVLGPRGRVTVPHAPASPWPLTRLMTFGALALYGILKWSTLLMGHPLSRLIGLFLLAMALAAGRPALARVSRPLAAIATFVALIAVFPIAGIPLAWVWHVRIAVTVNAIGDGLSGLPGVLVPYSGADQSIDLVMMLGAAVLLFDGALLVAFSPGPMTTLRRAGAALPLIALATVPTTLVRSAVPYLDGAILFTLLVAFMWGEEIGRRRTGGAIGIGAIAVLVGLFLGPALDQHKPWFNYRALAGSLAPTFVNGFDWSQGYGRIDWPRSGRVVLEVKATRPEYWKAENLDWFNGIGWTQSTIPLPEPSPSPSAQARWTQTITVLIRDMKTSQVIGAGTTDPPNDLPESRNSGSSPGTWTTAVPLGVGDVYQARVYAPHPSDAELNAAGTDYASLSSGYRTLELPPASGTPSPDENYFPENGPKTAKGFQAQVVFPPFHSGGTITSSGGPRGVSALTLLRATGVLDHHSLADVYLLAQRLAAGASTPYQFALAIENYLGRGFTYDENPPASPYPLVSFLFGSRRGYCQQFAGAMALLLRMGGVPSHVSVGFTPGRKDRSTGAWLVTAYDAHAWVEAWFPHYGWVRFDPTPGSDPALSNNTPIVGGAGGSGTNAAASGLGLSASKTVRGAQGDKRRGVNATAGGAVRRAGGGSSEVPWILGAIGLLAVVALGIATRPLRSAEAMVAELDGAFRRIGRPQPAGATLTSLERRVSASDPAAAYVRALRNARFRGSERLPTAAQRRALRRQLRRGLGPFGSVRSLWALPPRWGRPGNRRRAAPGRLQTRAPQGSGA